MLRQVQGEGKALCRVSEKIGTVTIGGNAVSQSFVESAADIDAVRRAAQRSRGCLDPAVLCVELVFLFGPT
jgi:hypothetical protein